MARYLAWLGDNRIFVWVEVEMDELAVLTIENEILLIET